MTPLHQHGGKVTIVHPEIIDTITLKAGSHDSLDDGACFLEAVSYVAGERWSDHPECVCPTLAAFGRSWNDSLDDDARNRLLKPFILRFVGTRSTADVENARAFLATDWVVRSFTPVWLRKAGLHDDAAALEALPALLSVELCRAAMPTISEARKSAAAARAAAWDAAWGAARGAARAAAGDAARAAARGAAGAAAWGARPHHPICCEERPCVLHISRRPGADES